MTPARCDCDRDTGDHRHDCARVASVWAWIEGDGDGLPVDPDAVISLADALEAVRTTCLGPETRFSEGWHCAVMSVEERLRAAATTPDPSVKFQVDNLAMLVRSLASRITRTSGPCGLTDRALAYLVRHGLQGSVCRDDGAEG